MKKVLGLGAIVLPVLAAGLMVTQSPMVIGILIIAVFNSALPPFFLLVAGIGSAAVAALATFQILQAFGTSEQTAGIIAL